MTDLRDGIRSATVRLGEAGVPSPHADAVALAAHALGLDVGEVRRLLVVGGRALPETYAALVDERARRVPLQHLTGQASFRHLTLRVGPGVFVPRPETEVLVDLALAEVDRVHALHALDATRAVRVADLCSGSGAIALSIRHERPFAAVRGLEVSREAWAWSTANRDRLGLEVDLALGDATQPCFEDWLGTVDVVTVNPPYIPVGALPLDPEVRDHDPAIALYGGSEDGLAIPLAVVRIAATLLRPGGLVLVEHADSQGVSLPSRLSTTGRWTDVSDHADLTGRPRVTSARRAAILSVRGSADSPQVPRLGSPA